MWQMHTNANKPNSLETPYNILWHHTTSLYTCIDCICIALYSLPVPIHCKTQPVPECIFPFFLCAETCFKHVTVSVHDSCPLEQRCLCWYSWASYSTNQPEHHKVSEWEHQLGTELWNCAAAHLPTITEIPRKFRRQEVPRVSVTKSRKSSTAPCPL
jgi:hypothetical protein